jgi:hypothetical protein
VVDDLGHLVFIANCRDEAPTRHQVQRFLLWLDQQGEDRLLAQRARSRRRIAGLIAREQGDGRPAAAVPRTGP